MSNEPAQGVAERKIGVLVLGLGNVLLGDDGLGAAAVARLEREYCVPPGVLLVDGGTLGLSLLGLLAEADHVILVDAVRADNQPGTLVRLDGEDVGDAVRDRLSPHQVGVADLLDAARLIDRYPASVTLLGLVPDTIDLAVVRSIAVAGCERDAAPSAPAGLLASPEARQAGEAIYAANCAICHGAEADGRGLRREGMHPSPANLTVPPWSDTATRRPDISRHS